MRLLKGMKRRLPLFSGWLIRLSIMFSGYFRKLLPRASERAMDTLPILMILIIFIIIGAVSVILSVLGRIFLGWGGT